MISRGKEKSSGKKEIWCLPKGKIEYEENPEEAALREVKEETGVEARIKEKIGKINYWFYKKENLRCNKTVHFYMMEFVNGKLSSESYEVEDVKWFSIKEALENMAYEKEKEIVKKVKRKIKR